MATTYTWVVNALDSYPTTPEDLTDVICVVHYTRLAVAIIDDKEYQASSYSTLSVPAPDPQDFVPYDQVTYDMVCGWLNAGLDTEAIDASLDVQIENIINPPIIQLPLPWITPTLTPAAEE